MRNVIILLRFE